MSTASTTRPLRSDAAENLRRVLAAALAVISADGVDASMEQIAHQAGVGVGTLYRRFPNKDALVEALLVSIFDELVGAADDALARADGTGLELFLQALGRSYVAHRGCALQLLARTLPGDRAAALRARIDLLVEDARDHGQIAPHATRGDVQALIWAMRGVVEATAALAPRAWERHLDLHLAALRLDPSPSHRASLTRPQLAAIAAASSAR